MVASFVPAAYSHFHALYSLLQGVESQTPARGARQLTSLARGSHCVHSDSARSPNYYAAEQAAERLAAWKEFIV